MRASKHILKCLTILAAIAFLASIVPHAMAANVTAPIPVKQAFESNRPDTDGRFRYMLEALTPGAPMPVVSLGSKMEFRLEGNQEIQLHIPYKAGNKWEYRIAPCVVSPEKNYTYDTAEYKVTIVFHSDGTGGRSYTMLIENSQGEKAESAHFSNSYFRPVKPSFDGPNADTGDHSHVYAYTAVMLSSFLLLMVLLLRKKREEREDEE